MTLLVSILLLALENRAAGSVSRPAACGPLLELSLRSQRALAEVVRRGEPSAKDAIAFVAMTARELRHLALNGVSRHRGEYTVFPNLDHPTVVNWRRDRPEYIVASPKGARDLEHEAWVRSMIELVAARADLPEHVPHVFAAVLEEFVSELRPMHPRLREKPFSADFARILRAAGEITSLPYDEPFTCDLETTGFLEETFNLGPNYARLVSRQRLRAFAMILGLRWDDVDAADSRARRELARLCADLPGHAGFRVALDAKAFNRIRWSGAEAPKLYDIDLSFVTGIEAFGEAERKILSQMIETTGERR